MLSILASGTRHCDSISRREMLNVGALGLSGVTLPRLLTADESISAAAGNAKRPKAKSCIVLFLMGGPPQHSTWDPKPDAPDDVRGEIRPIATKVPGLQF